MLPHLYLITQPVSNISYEDQVEKACRGGIKLVQLRMKNTTSDEYLDTAIRVKAVTKHFGATLIINDNPNIARLSGADGVHLGRSDMSPPEARKLLRPGMLLGGTADCFERICEIYPYVDYIGLGPFRFTTTKEKLSPILGIDRYNYIINRMREQKMNKPVFAIGGIILNDIPALLETGVYGIALSSSVVKAADITLAAQTYTQLIDKEKNKLQKTSFSSSVVMNN
jgi:thiamine-phosphate pyrophosphorylase